MTDLELVSTDNLLAEIMSRFDHAVFGGMKVADGDSDRITFAREWTGDLHMCAGLATDLAVGMVAQHRVHEQDVP